MNEMHLALLDTLDYLKHRNQWPSDEAYYNARRLAYHLREAKEKEHQRGEQLNGTDPQHP